MKGNATKKLLCSVLIIALVLGLLPQTGRSTKVQADDTLTTTVRAAKILTGEGAPALKDDQFTFILRDKSSGDEYTATNKADGSVVFENVSVPKRAGTYEFVMEEVKGNDPAITYDGEAKSVTVRVSEEGATSVFVTPQPVADFPANDGTNQHEGYGETWFRIGNPFVDENGNPIVGVQVTVKEGDTVVHRWITTADDSGKDIRVKAGVDEGRRRGLPIRVGVNGGSLEKPLLEKYGGVTAEAMAESAMGHVRLLEKFDFHDVCISVKASSVPLTIAAYRLLSQMTDCPLHLGVTEAGTEYAGLVKSAVGIGSLLSEGIGDTIRVSLTADPVKEVEAGLEILKALGLRRRGIEFISCPSCGRCRIDLIGVATEAERRLKGIGKNLTVAVMGCAVNGPGEASRADYGIAGGDGEGILFAKGKTLKKVPMDRLVDELVRLVNEHTEDDS